jgi:5-hydroxyisourate hydrolase
MAAGMRRISTHILDTVLGKPAGNVPVRLEKQHAAGEWRVINSASTDLDGRCPQLLPEDENLSAAVYRLIFETENYYGPQKIETLYPVVEVTFRAREGEAQFHIPLVLSPNGYTTYRGS